MVAPSLVSAVVDTPTAAAGLVVEPSSKPGSSSADLVSSLPVVGTLLRQTATWANTHYPFLWWSTQFLGQSAAWGLAWHGLGSLMAKLAWTLSPKYRALSVKRRSRFNAYLISIGQAVFCSLYSSTKLFFHDRHDYVYDRTVMKIMFGYFLQDFIRTRADWGKYKADFVHHTICFVVIYVTMAVGHFLSETVLQWVPRFFVAEFSTFWLNLMWINRELGGSAVTGARLKWIFVVSFFFLRVVWATLQIRDVLTIHADIMRKVGKVHYSLHAGLIMQWYWFFVMLAKFLRGKTTKTT